MQQDKLGFEANSRMATHILGHILPLSHGYKVSARSSRRIEEYEEYDHEFEISAMICDPA